MELPEHDFKKEFLQALKIAGCQMLEDGNIICDSGEKIYDINSKILKPQESVDIVTADLALSKQVSALWSYVHHDNNRSSSQLKKDEAYQLASAWSIIEENLLLNNQNIHAL